MLFYIRTCVTYDYFSFNNKILDFTNLILHFDVSFNYFCHVTLQRERWNRTLMEIEKWKDGKE